MSFKTSNKELKRHYATISVGYCNLQSLLDNNRNQFYNCGVYGWNWSAYIYGNVAIVDGYRNFPKDSYNFDMDIIYKYNQIGRLVNDKYTWRDYEKQKQLKEKLIYRLIREIKRSK